MANTPQAKKRARQAEKHREHNAARRSLMRTSIKKVLKAVEQKNPTGAREAYREVASIIDRLSSKNLLHRNAAARYKSRLNARVKSIATGA